MANNAKIIDVQTMLQIGMDPKTGLPRKMGPTDCQLKEDLKRNLQITDRQDAMNRYVWTGLPEGITADIIERILYYKGQGILFYVKSLEKFYFLPYALDGTIDIYGRYETVRPLPFGGGTDGKKKSSPISKYISDQIREPVYDIHELLAEITPQDLDTKCIILRDYTNGLAQTIEPRAQLQESILETMARCIPYMRTALMNQTGVEGVKVGTEDDYTSVAIASKSVEEAAINGEKYIPIVGNMEFQELTGNNIALPETFMEALQSLDNFRLGRYGIKNGGVFAKKAHMLQDEADNNQGATGLVYNDGLSNRQYFSILSNLLFGTSMWCEASEAVMGIDKNMDGEVSDEQDGQLPLDHPDNEGGMTDDE